MTLEQVIIVASRVVLHHRRSKRNVTPDLPLREELELNAVITPGPTTTMMIHTIARS